MMFPSSPYARKWTMVEIDSLDVHFFYDLLDANSQQSEERQYLSDIW
jgi:hypothetical protein